MHDTRLPPGVTQRMIDGPPDPRDTHCDDELWDCCSDRQQHRIMDEFLEHRGLDLIADIEDSREHPGQLKGIWRAYRDSAVERLLFDGHLRLPDHWFSERP